MGARLPGLFAILAAALAAADAAAVQFVRPNALLVVDESNQRVLRVSLSGGLVRTFSPPQGAPENLLTSPRGIGTGPDGTIVVANLFESTLVEIDPGTGAQFPVAGAFSGAPAIGSSTRDVAVNPREPAPGWFRTLGVAATGELHQVLRSGVSTTGSLLAPYPSPYDGYGGRFLAAREPGNDDPMDYFLATDSIPAILFYDGASDALTPIREYAGYEGIQGLDAMVSGAYVLAVSLRAEPCPSSANGVSLIRDEPYGTDSLLGGAYQCPGPVAFDESSGVVYVVDASGDPQRIIGYDTTQFPFGSTVVVATLPSGASASDMALAQLTVPEPGATALGAVAGTALGVARRWRRRRPARA